MIGGIPDIQVALGGYVFTALGVPERIPFGGRHRLGVHQLTDGVRVVDAMGADDRDITFTGLLLGPTAQDDARFLDYLRKRGDALYLTWGVFAYQVVIADFTPDFERFYQVTYTVTCKVIRDLTAPRTNAGSPLLDVLANADLSNILNAATSLGMTVPGSLPGSFSTTVGAPAVPTTAITAPPVS